MGSYNYTISIGHLGEQLTLNQWVLGSSPRWCTRKDVVMEITTSQLVKKPIQTPPIPV